MTATESLYGETFAPGALLGAYVVDELHSEGGFAAVYRARHADTGEPAAVKVLRSVLARSVRMIQRFLREAEAVGRIDHPNVVRVFEAGELSDGRPFIAMEWLPGRNLRDEIATRGPLAPRDALAVVREIAAALEAAHGEGVVHRDLKAQNVIAVPSGDWFKAKVVDFGIAKLHTDDDQGSSFTSRTILGTPHTAAPEQILGQPVDARTDVYALGILAYQLLTGRLPFDGGSPLEVEELHLHAPPPRASALAPVPPPVDAAIARAMGKTPDERFSTPGALVDALAGALGGASAPPERRSLKGAAVFIVADDDTDDDDVLETIDSALAIAEDAARTQGMQLAAVTPSTVLAVSVAADAAERADRVGAACLASAGSAPVRVATRTGVVDVRSEGDSVELVDGELLRPATWTDC